MDNTFRKLCHYYITNENEEMIKELEEKTENFEEKKEKAEKFIEKLRQKTNQLGYGVDFESFCNLLEEYINKKDGMEDEEKSKYLKILMTLSEIHEINLREELERYISYKKKDKQEINKEQIFHQFCRYNLKPNNDVEEFNELKELAQQNNLDFKELQKEAIIYVEEIKVLAESLGINIDEISFEEIVNEYLSKKHQLNDYNKARYLKVLLYLSEIFGINLRELLQEPLKQQVQSETLSIETIRKELTNPLDNLEVLSNLLNQRYYSGYFDIKEITLSEDDVVTDNCEINYTEFQAELAYKLYRIFLDKFNNYAFDDLNQEYLNLITEEDLSRLETLTQEEIQKIIELINNHESSHYIIKKYKLTSNLYTFIEKSLTEAIDLKKEHIGIGENSLFTNDNEQYTFRLYLNARDQELFYIIKEYIKKCVSENLNYNMKALGDNKDNQEGAILFASANDIIEKINIIEDILEQNPSISSYLKNPIYSSGTLNSSKYGISHSGITDEYNKCVKSYNDYFNIICEVAYYRTISKIIIDIISDNKAKETITNFINLNNVSFNNAEFLNPILAEYDGVNFEAIKDLINQYIPLVSATLSIYLTDKEQHKKIVEEFRKSLLYISNISQNRNKKANSNIAISSYIESL